MPTLVRLNIHRKYPQHLALNTLVFYISPQQHDFVSRLALAQTEFYVTPIEQLPSQSFRPFGFITNRHIIYFYGIDHQNKSLTDVKISRKITDRTHQMEAIQRVAEAITARAAIAGRNC